MGFKKRVLTGVGVIVLSVGVVMPVSADSGLASSEEGFAIRAVHEEGNEAIRGGLEVVDSPIMPDPGVIEPIMRFTVGGSSMPNCSLSAQRIFVSDVGEGTTITSPSGSSYGLREGVNIISTLGEWRIDGEFGLFGGTSNHTVDCITEVTEWHDTGTANVSAAFYNARNLTHVEELPSSVTNASNMFAFASRFDQDVTGWNVPVLTNAELMFSNVASFNNGGQPFDWDTPSLINASQMFFSSAVFNQDISDWKAPALESMGYMFRSASAFNNGGEPFDWDTPSLTNASNSFVSSLVFNQDISDWSAPRLEIASGLLNSATAFNNGGQPFDWDTPSLINVNNIFYGATSFNQDISDWNVPALTHAEDLVYRASAFNNGGQPFDWDTPSLISVARGLALATSFDQDISDWNAPSLENINILLSEAAIFNNGGQVFDWSTPSLISATHALSYTYAFNQDITNWNVPLLENASNMLHTASRFNNGGQVFDWSTPSLTNASYIFYSATQFRQDSSSWDVCGVTLYVNAYTGISTTVLPTAFRAPFGMGC